jgi:hypothetical protein
VHLSGFLRVRARRKVLYFNTTHAREIRVKKIRRRRRRGIPQSRTT